MMWDVKRGREMGQVISEHSVVFWKVRLWVVGTRRKKGRMRLGLEEFRVSLENDGTEV